MPVQVTAAEHLDELAVFARTTPDYTAALHETALMARTDETQRFETDTDPNGTPWQPLAPSTVRRKGHATILEDTGVMRTAATTDAPGHVEDVRDNTLTYGIDGDTQEGGIPWGFVQQAGNDRLPARPFIGLSKEGQEKAGEILAEHEAKRWQ